MNNKRIGFIGVGKMGKPMVLKLLKAGFFVSVHDVMADNMKAVAQLGATCAASPKEVVGQTDVIVLSLPTIGIMEKVVLGEDGLLSGHAEDKVIVDTTTGTMQSARHMEQRCLANGAVFLDSPVTGGVYGAEHGNLAFFVGGSRVATEAQDDVFSAMGHATWIGESGHGQVGKMVCQMIGSANILIAIEAAGFAMHLGVDADKINAVLAGGGKGPMDKVLGLLKSGDYDKEGYLAQRSKDIDYCLDEASRSHTFLPLTSAMQQMFNIARMKGLGQLDNEAIITLYEEWMLHDRSRQA